MKLKRYLVINIFISLITACSPSPEALATQNAGACQFMYPNREDRM